MRKARRQFLKIAVIVLIFYFFYSFLYAKNTNLAKNNLESVADLQIKDHQNVQVKFFYKFVQL